MGLESEWNNVKRALRHANVDLEWLNLAQFDVELESALIGFDEAYQKYTFATEKKTAQQARLLIAVISKAQTVESIVAEYGRALERFYEKATDHKQRLGLLVACSHLMKIRQVLSQFITF